MITSRLAKSRKALLGTVALVCVLVGFLYLTGKPQEQPAALRARLEKEALAELEREDQALAEKGLTPPSEPNDRMIRFLNILLGKVDLMEESPAAVAVGRDIANVLARSLKENEEKRALLEQIANESIEESVQALTHAPFSKYFNPKLADPLRFDIVLGSYDSAEEVKKDPRVQRLLEVAEHGTDEDRTALLNSLADSFENRSQLGAIDACPEPCSYFSGPGMAIPLLLSALDQSGDTLPLLVDMGHAYNKWIFDVHYDVEDNAMLNGKGPMTMYSGINAMAVESILGKLAATERAATPELLEYIDTRMTVQRLFIENPYIASVEATILAEAGVASISEIGILELQHHARHLMIKIEAWADAFPDWFQPGNIEWAVMAMGNRVNISMTEDY